MWLACTKAAALGFLVAAPVGPVGALCISRTLGSGAIVGLSAGLGAATVHGLWTLVIVLGLGSAGTTILDPWGSVVAAILLTYIGARAYSRPRLLIPPVIPMPTAVVCASAYLSGLALATANPTTPLLLLSTMPDLYPADAALSLHWLLLGLGTFVGSCFWWVVLSSATASLRRHATASVLSIINRVTGMVLIVLAGAFLGRAIFQ